MTSSSQPATLDPEAVRDYVRERYGAIATQADASCGCGPTCCAPLTDSLAGNAATAVATAVDGRTCCTDDVACGCSYGEQLGYSAEELAAAPAGADLGLGCGNPLAIAHIKPGETVLDLGSGAGFDCFLAARQLAGAGTVIGVDMTAAMITKARANLAKAGFTNVEFRLGEIEALPVADASVDLILSNCVINLVPDKARVFREAFRVLRTGGRLAIADVVATRPLPETLRWKLGAIGACVGGAALVDDVRAMLAAAGFSRIALATRESSRAMISQWTEDPTAGEFVVSAFVTAYKP